jgi:hypothetical protein
MIEDYLLVNGIRKPALFERILRGDLTKQIRHKVEEMLKR